MPLIELHEIRAGYGEIEVLKGISLDIVPGQIYAIIGANGAGKSTLLKTLFGLVSVSSGSILYSGQDITNAPPIAILKSGISYVPQGRSNFPAMTIQENLEMGGFTRKDKAAVARDIDRLCQHFPILETKRKEKAGNLSGGQQQVLEMAIALIMNPDVLLIDEPTLGLSPLLVGTVFEAIQEINAGGTTVVMVEQNAKRALEIAHHGFVLDLGRVRFEGSGESLLHNPDVRRHYLGL
jgi:branched-chain amino acid transport system ATP-binding protein